MNYVIKDIILEVDNDIYRYLQKLKYVYKINMYLCTYFTHRAPYKLVLFIMFCCMNSK